MAYHPGLILRTLLFAFGLIHFLLLGSGCDHKPQAKASSRNAQKFHFPKEGAYCGAYLGFGLTEDSVSLDMLMDFEKLVGRHQAIIASSSYWGEQGFPSKNIRIIDHYGAIPMIYWSPWDRPYLEFAVPGRFSLRNILDGQADSYIDSWADGAKEFGKPLLVSWGLEMNGDWFPWSGSYYGMGRDLAPPGEAPLFEGPDVFRRAFRHVVERVRARGALNILWGFHVNAHSYPEEPWNVPAQYYPGDAYVDWLGISAYGMQTLDDPWISFRNSVGPSYDQLSRLSAEKPIFLAEWGVGEFGRFGSKPQWIQEAFEAFKTDYPRVRGAVYWHERWQNPDGSYSNLRVNSSPESLRAYRRGMADAYWLDRLSYGP